jgi:hypothetical protein
MVIRQLEREDASRRQKVLDWQMTAVTFGEESFGRLMLWEIMRQLDVAEAEAGTSRR